MHAVCVQATTLAPMFTLYVQTSLVFCERSLLCTHTDIHTPEDAVAYLQAVCWTLHLCMTQLLLQYAFECHVGKCTPPHAFLNLSLPLTFGAAFVQYTSLGATCAHVLLHYVFERHMGTLAEKLGPVNVTVLVEVMQSMCSRLSDAPAERLQRRDKRQCPLASKVKYRK
eukprot:1156557-Pelagomonas_calceolata.AAC.11